MSLSSRALLRSAKVVPDGTITATARKLRMKSENPQPAKPSDTPLYSLLSQSPLDIAICRNREDFFHLSQSEIFLQRNRLEEFIARQNADREVFYLPGYSRVAGQPVEFLVDRIAGRQLEDGLWLPRWRERLLCPHTGLNSRQRAVCEFLDLLLRDLGKKGASVYMMEQITPTFRYISDKYGNHLIIGSEYLGPDTETGVTVNGVRHEDAERLSFAGESLDIIISNDVLEHVNEPGSAMEEMVRALRPGGHLLMTIPFHKERNCNIRRARVVEGRIEHLMEPQYHSNPIDEAGVLVFFDYGWEVLDLLRNSGFSDAFLITYWSLEFGLLGGPQPVFYARKS